MKICSIEESPPLCPETGTPMRRGVKPLTLEYKGLSLTFDMPGWYCDVCEEAIFSGRDMRVSDRMLNLLKARQEGLLEPGEIRGVRKKLHLTQEEAGRLLGGGPRAFQKYESGDVLPSRAVCSVLLLLDRDPGGLETLSGRRGGVRAAEGANV